MSRVRVLALIGLLQPCGISEFFNLRKDEGRRSLLWTQQEGSSAEDLRQASRMVYEALKHVER